MKRSTLGAGAIGLAAVLLIAFVAHKSQSLDFQEHSRYQAALVHLKELEGELGGGAARRVQAAMRAIACIGQVQGIGSVTDS